MRKVSVYPFVGVAILGAVTYFGFNPKSLPFDLSKLGGDPEASETELTNPDVAVSGANPNGQIVSTRGNNAAPQANSQPFVAKATKSQQSITIASYNIQVFGQEKIRNSWVLERLVAIARQFDVIGIQEIRSDNQELIEQFIAAINADGSRFSYVIGPRLGRTNSKEQYAFVYDTTRIRCNFQRVYTVDDAQDLLHREPLVAHFEVASDGTFPPFTFTLINMHTDPDEVDPRKPNSEINVLADVYKNVRAFEFPEDDVILMGDLNAAPAAFGKLGQIPGVVPLIRTGFSNTKQTKLYDNILVDQYSTQEFTGRAGVWDLVQTWKIPVDDALKISDHFPVWAEFGIVEVAGNSPAMAKQPGGAVR